MTAVPERTPAPEDGAAERLRAIKERLNRGYSYEVRVRRRRNPTPDVRFLLAHVASLTADLAASRAEVERLREQAIALGRWLRHAPNCARRLSGTAERCDCGPNDQTLYQAFVSNQLALPAANGGMR